MPPAIIPDSHRQCQCL